MAAVDHPTRRHGRRRRQRSDIVDRCSGGPTAAGGGGSVGRPRCSRMARLASPWGRRRGCASRRRRSRRRGRRRRTRASGGRPSRVGSVRLSRVGWGGGGGGGARRNDGGAKVMVGCEHAVVTGQMGARWRDERGKATQEVDRGERELGPAVVQGTLERKDDASTRIARELRVGDRRSRTIATLCAAPKYADHELSRKRGALRYPG